MFESSLNIQLQNPATIEIFVQYVLKAVAIKFEYHNLYMVSILMFDSKTEGKDNDLLGRIRIKILIQVVFRRSYPVFILGLDPVRLQPDPQPW